MSMAQRQRITDESSVQIPKVRAWRPFTVVKKARVLRRGGLGYFEMLSISLVIHRWLSLPSLCLDRVEALVLALVLHLRTRGFPERELLISSLFFSFL
jgi:hypothetical protein